ncbi:MAG TPA: hypothetical protein VMU51_28710 [Mycobacteriales bacterium]|nr:hypothetical protein [Mycobacteriales bacterium]
MHFAHRALTGGRQAVAGIRTAIAGQGGRPVPLPTSNGGSVSRSARRVRHLVVLLLSAAAFIGVQSAPASAAGGPNCPAGYVKVSVEDFSDGGFGSWRVNIFRSPDNIRVAAKIENTGAIDLVNEVWHGKSGLGRQLIKPGHGWCSNTAPQPITVWTNPVGRHVWYWSSTYPSNGYLSPDPLELRGPAL